jgi:hypothetical protein
MQNSKTWGIVVLYATSMAWVESAVVFYLRTMINRIEPYQATPLPVAGGFGFAEMIRELATMLMLLTVGFLAGRNWRSRIGYSAIAFGVWDILYYVFLKVMCGWPHSLMDWDVLFLIPLPWWGPVLAPVMIALLMVVWGTFASQVEDVTLSAAPGWRAWLLNGIGILLALYVFMSDALRVSGRGVNALRELLPASFNWPLFLVAWLLMAAPVIVILREFRTRRILSVTSLTSRENAA